MAELKARRGRGRWLSPARSRARGSSGSPSDALRSAGVAGVLPTPLEEVQRAAGITARHDIGELPPGVATPGRALLGALWFERREVYVDLAQSAAAAPLHRRPRGDARALPMARGGAARGHGGRAVPRDARSRSRRRPTTAPGC